MTTVSLVASVLSADRMLRNPAKESDRRKLCAFGALILRIALETADAVINNQYKRFDALIGNFGCQITALEVQQLLSKTELRQEAVRLYTRLPQVKEVQVSTDFSRLVRFRLLSVVNVNVLDAAKTREKPETQSEKLRELIEDVDAVTKNVLKDFVRRLQANESANAAAFIKGEANLLTLEDTPRAHLLQLLLGSAFNREKDCIVSTPLLYNTEVVFRRTIGLVLIKNKLFLLNERRPNEREVKVFMRFPQEEIVPEGDIAGVPDDTPLIVLEGYVRTENLAAQIQDLGFYTILSANTAIIPQYIKGIEDTRLDEKADADIATFSAQGNIADEVFEVEHVYCASMREER